MKTHIGLQFQDIYLQFLDCYEWLKYYYILLYCFFLDMCTYQIFSIFLHLLLCLLHLATITSGCHFHPFHGYLLLTYANNPSSNSNGSNPVSLLCCLVGLKQKQGYLSYITIHSIYCARMVCWLVRQTYHVSNVLDLWPMLKNRRMNMNLKNGFKCNSYNKVFAFGQLSLKFTCARSVYKNLSLSFISPKVWINKGLNTGFTSFYGNLSIWL